MASRWYQKTIDMCDIESILLEHKIWLESDGESGEQAILTGATLRDIVFHEGEELKVAAPNPASRANSKELNLLPIDLRYADMTEALIQAPKLIDANFGDAILDYAYFEGSENQSKTNLARAKFFRASLKHADLLLTKNLHDHQLIQADLSYAFLPDSVDFSGKIDAALRASSYARKLFTPLLIAGLAVLSASSFGNPTGQIDLKFISTKVNYTLGLIIGLSVLVLIYRYFAYYMSRMWRTLAVLPAVFPNGQPINRYPEPWFLANFLRPYIKHVLNDQSTSNARFADFSIYWLTPALLFLIWMVALIRTDFSWSILPLISCPAAAGLISHVQRSRSIKYFRAPNEGWLPVPWAMVIWTYFAVLIAALAAVIKIKLL